MEPDDVVERLGLLPEHIDDQEAAEALARGLATALMEDDQVAVGLLLDAFLEEHPDALVRALVAAAGLIGELACIVGRRLRVPSTSFIEFAAERSRLQHQHARAAVAAIVDGVPSEALDPEVDALRAAMVRDAFLLDALDGADIDGDERFDAEWRALLDAEARGHGGAVAGDVTPGGEGSP
jgi:hypothetical protein